MQNDMQRDWQNAYLEGENFSYLESLYERYLKNPDSLPDEWRRYFDEINREGGQRDVSLEEVRHEFREMARQPVIIASAGSAQDVKESRVAELINAYRAHGHHQAKLDPLNLTERHPMPTLRLDYHGLSDADLTTRFHAGAIIGKPNATLREIVEILNRTYCETIGVEYMHITSEEEITWLQSKMEPVANHPHLEKKEKVYLLDRLNAAEGLEKFLGTKYVGQKRFSLEGGDSLIPMMGVMIRHSTLEENVKEVVMGMAHRGRLNVLINIVGKSPSQLFDEFEGRHQDSGQGSGDVKYHKGFSANVAVDNQAVHLALAFNPSHLEIVSPVVEGSVRARQRRRKDEKREQVMPILIHGDAAISGQGIVMETLTLSQARGFSTGGSIHIVINNQVGFTTSNPLDARSTLYCTDIMKMIQAPIFHVNGDDPEAVAFVSKLAAEYRAKFHKDVCIDLVCYRRQGHNEADDPSITQPQMYAVIRALPTTRELYANRLIQEGVLTADEVRGMYDAYIAKLDAGQPVVETVVDLDEERYAPDWAKHVGQKLSQVVDTAVPLKELKALAERLETIPADFGIHPQVKRLLDERAKMTAGEAPLNWGYAETLAYATLVDQKYSVRLCGQDSGRGTFAHRHAVLHDTKTKEVYVPLQHISEEQGSFIVIDSLLSEAAVLGFEYGYATAEPEALVLWEAQFGDFANGAQVVIDQFISSGEQKWNRLCGLVMLLPHGYEGMGPEHSSARLERYLQLCAQDNMEVCVPTTPAQMFHMLRRQMIRLSRKPLIVMTPKSLLRHKLAVSSLNDLASGGFQRMIPEIDPIKPADVHRVILCSGKVYYDLLQKRRDEKMTDVILRIEQLYPFPRAELSAELAKYTKAHDVIGVQEEPKNQGAWYQTSHHLVACLAEGQHINYAGRAASASPASGYAQEHGHEQAALVAEALGL